MGLEPTTFATRTPHRQNSPPYRQNSLRALSDVEGDDQNCLRPGEKQATETEVIPTASYERPQNLQQFSLYIATINNNEDDNYVGLLWFETTQTSAVILQERVTTNTN